MSKNMTLGAVATICILLVLCFSYFTFNDSERITTGEYEGMEIEYAYFDSNGEPHISTYECNFTIVIESAKGDFVRGTFNGNDFIGTKYDDRSFTFKGKINDIDMDVYAIGEKNTLVLSALGMKKTVLEKSYTVSIGTCISSFVIKGQTPAVDPASLIPDQSNIKVGTNWNSVQAFCNDNGATSDIEGRNYEILKVENGFFFAKSHISTQNFYFSGTFFGNNVYKAIYADLSNSNVFMDDVVFTDDVIYTNSVTVYGMDNIPIYAVNYANSSEDIPSFKSLGRTSFTGSITNMGTDGIKKTDKSITISFSNQYKNTCYIEIDGSKAGAALSKISDDVYHIKYSGMKSDGASNIMGEGTYIESTGALTLNGFVVNDNAVTSVFQISAQKINEEFNIVGTHTVSEGGMAYVSNGELYVEELSSTCILVIESAENGIIKGTWATVPFIGTYASGKLSFTISYTFDDGKTYYYLFEGNTVGNTIIAEVVAYEPDSAINLVVSLRYGDSPAPNGGTEHIDNDKELVEEQRTIQVGETWYSYDAYSNIGGEITQISEPYTYTYVESKDGFDHMRVVNNSTGEVFEFVGTHSGKLFISTTEGKIVIDHIDNEDGILKTSSVDSNGITAYVVSYSADAAPTDVYPELDGKTYVGTEFLDVDGEQKSVKASLKFSGQYKNSVSVSAESSAYSDGFIAVSKFSGTAASFYSSAYFDIDGEVYSGMYKGYFSEDNKTLTVYGNAMSADGKHVAFVMDLKLEA